jgi:hypothetical protein
LAGAAARRQEPQHGQEPMECRAAIAAAEPWFPLVAKELTFDELVFIDALPK